MRHKTLVAPRMAVDRADRNRRQVSDRTSPSNIDCKCAVRKGMGSVRGHATHAVRPNALRTLRHESITVVEDMLTKEKQYNRRNSLVRLEHAQRKIEN